MDTYLLVDEKNSILHRTQEYLCEKKWYKFKSIRPQKSALKVYNSICFHNKYFKSNENNFVTIDSLEKEIKVIPRIKIEETNEKMLQYVKNFSLKIQNCIKKPKSLVVHIRKTKTNKLYSYIVKTILNWYPNLYELKHEIIFKTKSIPIEKFDTISKLNFEILNVEDYKIYL
jgi:hypothetical protein